MFKKKEEICTILKYIIECSVMLYVTVLIPLLCICIGKTLVEYYDIHRQKLTISFSLLYSGPFVSALCARYGCRRVTMAGSLIASISFFLSTQAPNIEIFIITYSVFGGLLSSPKPFTLRSLFHYNLPVF